MASPGGPSKPKHNVMVSLFGTECSEWPFSDSSLVQALAFKTQQEKTKQQYYKLECVNRSIELLKTAVNARIPGPMIAQLFQGSGSGSGSGLGSGIDYNKSQETSGNQVPTALRPSRADSAPLNYSFPPGNYNGARASANIHRRTNSPARIGAAAVASLAEHRDLKEEDKDELPLGPANQHPPPPPPPSYHMNGPSPLQFRSHRRNFSVPLARPAHLSPQETPAQYPARRTHNPMTSVINFGSWQSYDPAPPSTIRRAGPIRKHRKTKSASVTPNFGVIDMNAPNQMRLPELGKPSDYYVPKEKGHIEDENDFDDQQTCSEHSSRETTPIPQVTKGPNFANNLLNS
ncbi:LAFA_0E21132g1_1 [Lachancea sp. 'fantastica']|nr:LAFA_0E21132g1_1 [Lachancea sp. 'fantastica']